jgi:hypothetical protein
MECDSGDRQIRSNADSAQQPVLNARAFERSTRVRRPTRRVYAVMTDVARGRDVVADVAGGRGFGATGRASDRNVGETMADSPVYALVCECASLERLPIHLPDRQ